MQLTNQQTLPVSQAIAWQALNDIDLLKECIPCLLYTSPSPRD